MRKLELIDFLKGYSIFTIVFFHYLQVFNLPAPYNHFISFGGTGVHLFILLSGFGLYYSYLNKHENYITYLRRRFSRVYIPYIITVLLSVLISIFLPVYDVSLYSVLGHIFLFKMFDENIVGTYGYPLWFISMIFQFYFIFYILVFIKEKFNNLGFLLFCILLSVAWAGVVVYLGKVYVRVWNSFFLQYLWEFALGMVIATWLHKGKDINLKINPYLLFGIGLICCAIYGYLAIIPGGIGKLFNDIPALVGYSFLGIWLYHLKNTVIEKFMLFTGKISYNLYLLHILVFALISLIMKDVPIYINVFFAFIISYLVSFYYQYMLLPVYKLPGIK